MVTATVSLRRASWLRPKYFLFSFITLMILYVLRHNEHFLIDHKDPIWQHYEPFKWVLLPHGLAGACAIFLGPLQFSDRLRARYTKLHRVIGRIYIASVFVIAPLGTYIQYFQERSGEARSFTMAAAVDAFLLMTTTAIAFAFILNGKVQQHRQWMSRSFAVALVFLEVRVVGGVMGWDALGPAVDEAIVWGCLAFAVFSADVVLQVQELLRLRHAPAKA